MNIAASLVWEMGFRKLGTLTPGGSKNGSPGVEFRPPGWSQMAFLRRPGASWAPGGAQEDALGGKGGVEKNFATSKMASWGPLGAFFARFGPPPPPPQGTWVSSGRSFLELF